MSMVPPNDIPCGFVPIEQGGTFISHVGGLHWHRHAEHSEVCLLLRPQHLNPNGTAHGGLLLTILDILLGATVESYLGAIEGRHPATIQLSCSMLAPAHNGELVFGEAAVDNSTRTVTFVSGRLHSNSKTVLTASAVFRNGLPGGRETGPGKDPSVEHTG